jgi:hypothetical protein
MIRCVVDVLPPHYLGFMRYELKVAHVVWSHSRSVSECPHRCEQMNLVGKAPLCSDYQPVCVATSSHVAQLSRSILQLFFQRIQ